MLQTPVLKVSGTSDVSRVLAVVVPAAEWRLFGRLEKEFFEPTLSSNIHMEEIVPVEIGDGPIENWNCSLMFHQTGGHFDGNERFIPEHGGFRFPSIRLWWYGDICPGTDPCRPLVTRINAYYRTKRDDVNVSSVEQLLMPTRTFDDQTGLVYERKLAQYVDSSEHRFDEIIWDGRTDVCRGTLVVKIS